MIKVSIPHRYYKSSYTEMCKLAVAEFQFLIGIINLISRDTVSLVLLLFQFLIGIINLAYTDSEFLLCSVSIPHRYYKSFASLPSYLQTL